MRVLNFVFASVSVALRPHSAAPGVRGHVADGRVALQVDNSAVYSNAENAQSNHTPTSMTQQKSERRMHTSSWAEGDDVCRGSYARTDLLKRMLDALNSGKGDPIKQSLLQQHEPVIMTITTRHVACVHDSFAMNAAAALEKPTTILAINLDQKSQDRCLAHPLGSHVNRKESQKGPKTTVLCSDLTGWVPDNIDTMGSEASSHNKVSNIGFGSCGYHVMVWTKPVLLKYAAEHAEHGILLMDSDVVLHRDLLRWVLANRRPDVAMVTEQWLNEPWPSTGAVYADKKSSAILQRWVNACTVDERFHGDTEELKDLVVADKSLGAQIQFIPNNILGECADKAATVATHYNCVEKISTMETHGTWAPHDPACKQ